MEGMETQATETVETTVAITLVDVQQVRDDIINADLFGSFLICGAIVAAVLFRR